MPSLTSAVTFIACFVAVQGSLRFQQKLVAAPKVALISQLGDASAPAPAAPPPAFPGDMHYDDEKYTAESWGKEWKNGNFPGYKITNPLGAKFADRQSDGKASKAP